MKSFDLLDAMSDLDPQYIQKADQPVRRHSPVRILIPIAACLALVISGILLHQRLLPAPAPETSAEVSSTESSALPESAAAAEDEKPASDESGVTIPKAEIDYHAEADMIPFFIYQDGMYSFYEAFPMDAPLIGEHLGTVTKGLDEWSSPDAYVNLSGSITGDFYSVQGYDPSFLLCMRQSDGQIWTFIRSNGISFSKGSDLYEDLLHLTATWSSARYESQNSWYESLGQFFVLQHPEEINTFIAGLNKGRWFYSKDIPRLMEKRRWHLYLDTESGFTVHLILCDDGYVLLDGLMEICLQVDEDSIRPILDLLEFADERIPAESPEPLTLSLEDCIADPDLGSCIPTMIPEGWTFFRGWKTYESDAATGAILRTQEINLEYQQSEGWYAITVTPADRYEICGWAGTLIDADALTLEKVRSCLDPDRQWLDLGIRKDDVMIIISGRGLSAEEGYVILSSI